MRRLSGKIDTNAQGSGNKNQKIENFFNSFSALCLRLVLGLKMPEFSSHLRKLLPLWGRIFFARPLTG